MSDCILIPSTTDSEFPARMDHDQTTFDTASKPSSNQGEPPSESSENQNEDNGTATQLEAPLRRSKRSKGRGNQGFINAGREAVSIIANGAVSNNGFYDERVTSCTLDGTEYQIGDFIYYEEADFQYYTIGLIEDIKLSRRDRFSLTVKCFYRTQDIPQCAKQSLLEREIVQSTAVLASQNEVFSRELFVSEVQETIAARQLRGRCKVSHLSDLRTALKSFRADEEDSFFYVFAYNPESRRLVHTKAEIRIGDAFQAFVPKFRHPTPAAYRFRPHPRDSKHCRHPSKRFTKSDECERGILKLEEPDHHPMERAPSITNEQYGPSDNECKPSRDSEVLKSPPTLENFGPQPTTVPESCSVLVPRRCKTTRRHPRRHRRRFETLLWKPDGLCSGAHSSDERLTDEPLKTYLDAVRSMVAFFGFGGADDDLSSAENGLVLANLSITTQYAYDTLHQNEYSLKNALKSISRNPIPGTDTPRHWTVDQVRLFAHALRIHGKDFHAIQRDFFGGRLSANNQARGPTGRPSRGRGLRRKMSSKLPKCGDEVDSAVEVKSEELSTKSAAASEDSKQSDVSEAGVAAESLSPSQPTKTIKQLIAFYYYWKRKGAAANPAAACSSTSSSSSGLLINNATVNFAAAVTAAANSEAANAISNGSGAGGTSTQSFSGAGKKRRFPTSRGNALRTSTPTSELSCGSAVQSHPDSEVEDIPEPVDSKSRDPENDTDSTTEFQNRRRLCRNCGQASGFSSDGTQATSGGSQLKSLCDECRVHMLKYGELRFHPMPAVDASTGNVLAGEGDAIPMESTQPERTAPHPCQSPTRSPLANRLSSPYSFCSPACSCSEVSWCSSPCPHSDCASCGSNDELGALHSPVQGARRVKRRRHGSRVESMLGGHTTKLETDAVSLKHDPEPPAVTLCASKPSPPSLAVDVASSPMEAEPVDSETELELSALAETTKHRAPVPCTIPTHTSPWSRLVRVWDRSAQVMITRENHTTQTVCNSGSCARTDMVYTGRPSSGLEAARQQLYQSHCDTLFGPGVAMLKPEGDQPQPQYPDPSSALNLSAKSHDSPPETRMPTSSRPSSGTNYSIPQNPPLPPPSLFPAPPIYDPSPTQQQLQAAYEQAMLLSAATASSSSHHHTSLSDLRSGPFSSPRSTPLRNPSCTTPLSSRLSAAAGTFFPPALVSSVATSSVPRGPSNSFSPMLHAHALWNAASGGSHPGPVQTPSQPLASGSPAPGSIDPRELELFRWLLEQHEKRNLPSRSYPQFPSLDSFLRQEQRKHQDNMLSAYAGGDYRQDRLLAPVLNTPNRPVFRSSPLVTNPGVSRASAHQLDTIADSYTVRNNSSSHISNLLAGTPQAGPSRTSLGPQPPFNAKVGASEPSAAMLAQMQEQLMNAARLAMHTAQSDPNAATVHLASILSEMAAGRKITPAPQQPPATTPSMMMTTTTPRQLHSPSGNPMLDFRAAQTRRRPPLGSPNPPQRHSSGRQSATHLMMSGGLGPNNNNNSVPSSAQLAHLNQIAQAAGLGNGASMSDPSVLNALSLAAAAAYAAGPNPPDSVNPFPVEGPNFDRHQPRSRPPSSPSSGRNMQDAVAAAIAAFPHLLFNQTRFPSSHP